MKYFLLLLLSCVEIAAQALINPYAFGAGASSTLNTGIIAYWKMDEASGNRADSSGSSTLTDNNTVTSTTGKINNAAGYTAANSESLSRADDATLSTGDIDFSVSLWVYFPSLGALGANRDLVAKWGAAGQSEYLIRYNSVSGFIDFLVSNNGTATTTRASTVAIFQNTWYHVVCIHDSVNNTLKINVNGTTDTTASYTSGVFDSTSALGIGGRQAGTPAYMEGYIDEVGFWKKALSAGEITELNNSGNGKTCCPFAAP